MQKQFKSCTGLQEVYVFQNSLASRTSIQEIGVSKQKSMKNIFYSKDTIGPYQTEVQRADVKKTNENTKSWQMEETGKSFIHSLFVAHSSCSEFIFYEPINQFNFDNFVGLSELLFLVILNQQHSGRCDWDAWPCNNRKADFVTIACNL